jgi:hypothetical protein
MDKLIGLFTSFKGDNVDLNLIEMAFYGLVPFGQVFMRINKYGGSLDKPYLLFPLLLIPPFSIIPVLIAKFGFLKKVNGTNIFDGYILIPIIFRFVLIFIMAHLGEFGGPIFQALLVFATLVATNIFRLINDVTCASNKEGLTIDKIFKQVGDSMIEYSLGIVIILLFTFLPFVKVILELISMFPLPFVGKVANILDSILWSVGLIGGYILVHMFDANFVSNSDSCAGKTGILRLIISIIAFAVAIYHQFRGDLSSLVGMGSN